MTALSPLRRAEHEIPAPQHSAPEPCQAASSLEMVQRWRSQLGRIQEEMDLQIQGRMDVYHLEDASNKLEPVIAALRKEMHRIEDGEL